jgi:hypothetical protein
MYYPYLRGKQNELILLREQAELIANSKIIPIIEPVKKNLKPLNRALDQLEVYNTEYIYVINPIYGEFSEDNSDLISNIQRTNNIIIGIIITAETNIDEILYYLNQFDSHKLAILHQGFSDGKELSSKIVDYNIVKHIFVNTEQNKLYQRQFKNQGDRVLIRDSFRKTKNAHYPKGEHFSDLHITYEEENMDGFGDFLIVGDDYSVSGGPAYAIAIHITYLQPLDDDNMYIKHYVSDRVEGVNDPGGKFLEALKKLIDDMNLNPELFNTSACEEYRDLSENEHFPGLGYAKKLSMQHHIEILANFLDN